MLSRIHGRVSLLALLSLVLAFFGCASTSTGAASAGGGGPKNAHEIAQNMIGGKVSVLVFVDRVRRQPGAAKFLQIGTVKDVLEGTSFDPLNDVERVFVTGPSAADQRVIVFAEHRLPPERIPSTVAEMVKKSDPPGQVLSGFPNWRVKVSKKGREGIVAFLGSRFLVVVPPDLANRIDEFEATGGLPGPTGEEAAQLHAVDPSNTLRAKYVPPIPPTISALSSEVFVKPDGGVTIDASGQSTAERAPQDAAELTKNIDDATSFGIGIFKIRAVRPMVFTAAGDHVVTHHDMSPTEVETLISLAASFVQ